MQNLIKELPVYAKAFVGAIGAGLLTLAGILVGDMTLADLTQAQWLMVVIAVLGVGGTVGVVPNKQTPLQRENQMIAEQVKKDVAQKSQVKQDIQSTLILHGVDDVGDLPDDSEFLEERELEGDPVQEEIDLSPVDPDYQAKHSL